MFHLCVPGRTRDHFPKLGVLCACCGKPSKWNFRTFSFVSTRLRLGKLQPIPTCFLFSPFSRFHPHRETGGWPAAKRHDRKDTFHQTTSPNWNRSKRNRKYISFHQSIKVYYYYYSFCAGVTRIIAMGRWYHSPVHIWEVSSPSINIISAATSVLGGSSVYKHIKLGFQLRATIQPIRDDDYSFTIPSELHFSVEGGQSVVRYACVCDSFEDLNHRIFNCGTNRACGLVFLRSSRNWKRWLKQKSSTQWYYFLWVVFFDRNSRRSLKFSKRFRGSRKRYLKSTCGIMCCEK